MPHWFSAFLATTNIKGLSYLINKIKQEHSLLFVLVQLVLQKQAKKISLNTRSTHCNDLDENVTQEIIYMTYIQYVIPEVLFLCHRFPVYKYHYL